MEKRCGAGGGIVAPRSAFAFAFACAASAPDDGGPDDGGVDADGEADEELAIIVRCQCTHCEFHNVSEANHEYLRVGN